MPNLRVLATCCVRLELRSLPSTGVTRLQRYYQPLRHPTAPGLSVTGARLVEQPDLAALAQPYAPRLLATGVSRIETPGVNGTQLVGVETPNGYFYIHYREGLASAPFELIARDNTASVRSDTYLPAKLPQYREAINWVVPEVLRVAPGHEAEMWAMQHGSGR